MKKRSVLLGLVLVLLVGAAPALAITWGLPDEDNLYENVGAMIASFEDETYPVCTGTLIDEKVFLTAGHCTDYVEFGLAEGTIKAVYVSFDYDPMARGAKWLDVAEIITHPDYWWGPTSNPHDVGVLILDKPAKKVTPATLPPEGFLDQLLADGELHDGSDRARFTVVGYGGTLYWPPPEIVYGDKRQYAESEYLKLLKAWLHLSQNQATGDGGTCYGDSGGPSFWVEEDGTEILVGITSWGDAQCVSSGFNYRVDIPDTLDFVYEVIGSLE
jgi:hypothetical protein